MLVLVHTCTILWSLTCLCLRSSGAEEMQSSALERCHRIQYCQTTLLLGEEQQGRKQTILIYSYQQASYMQWDRSVCWSIWQPALGYPVTATWAWCPEAMLTAIRLEVHRDKTRTENDAIHPKKSGNRSSFWVLPLGQVTEKQFHASNTLC